MEAEPAGDAQRAAAGRLLHRLELAGGVDEGLGRDAAHVQAGAPQLARVHDDGVEPQLAAADGAGVAAGAAPMMRTLGERVSGI
jgi:hypothetical protein